MMMDEDDDGWLLWMMKDYDNDDIGNDDVGWW